MVWPVDDLVRLADIITDVAAGDPISFALIVVGSVLLVGSMLVVGALALGGVMAPLYEA